MGYPIGLAPKTDGTGTTPEDFQRWIWSLYRSDTAALARGGTVKGTSSMAYQVDPAIVIIPTGTGRAVAVPVEAATVATPSAPSSGTRTDFIVVGQDGAVKVASSHTAGTALLDKRTVPAGITATTATSSLLGDRKFAPLFGGTMGQIAAWKESLADKAIVPTSRAQVAAFTFTLDSPRRIEAHLQVSYANSADANVDADAWKVPTFMWEIWLDGIRVRSVELAVEAWPETKQARFGFDINEGTHTMKLFRSRNLTGGASRTSHHRVGGTENWPGTTFTLTDLGGLS